MVISPNQRGFTIVELLIVIVVIAILAVITIVAFNGVQNRAKVSSLTSSLNQAKKKLEYYKVDNGAYPITGNLASAGLANTGSMFYQYTSDGATFCITGSTSGTSYNATETSAPTSGACSGQVDGGMITNFAANPSAETNVLSSAGYYASPITRTNTDAASGSWSYTTTTNSTTQTQGMIFNGDSNSAPATTYTCSMSFKGTPGTVAHFSGRPETSAGGYLTESLGTTPITLSSVWQRPTITFTTPANTGQAKVQIRIGTAASGVNILADALMCTKSSSSYGFADGNSASWTWNGTMNNSTSTGPAS